MKKSFKKIAVCHGPTCGPNGARKIKKLLEEAYSESEIEITERECCGRCSDHNTIMLDDEVAVSHLDKNTIKDFIADPDVLIASAQKEKEALSEKIDNLLSSDDLL